MAYSLQFWEDFWQNTMPSKTVKRSGKRVLDLKVLKKDKETYNLLLEYVLYQSVKIGDKAKAAMFLDYIGSQFNMCGPEVFKERITSLCVVLNKL